MANYSFKFLENDEQFADIAKTFKEMEIELVEEKPVQSVIMAGKAFELITLYLCDEEDYQNLKEYDQHLRIQELSRRVIPLDLQRNFHKVRIFRNKAVHENLPEPMETARRAHKFCFKVAVWLYDKYSNNDFIKPEYEGPLYEKVDHYEDKIDELFEKKSDEFQKHVEGKLEEILDAKLSETIKNPQPEVINPEPETTEIEEEDDFEGSYLLRELFKLNDSSREAVEGINEFTEFKKYMHVTRPIQNEFFDKLEEVADSPKSHLVMLCGSVGDGKSHLLSYLKETRPDLFEKFTVHQDATESFSTDKNAIDTLADVLTSFNNKNFNNSTEKFILAINLGVLNNFLESKYAKEDYSRLKKIIDESNIFNTENIIGTFSKDNVSIISFSDYNLFELNDSITEPVGSTYISALFDKVIAESKENPFYQAYLKDKENGVNSPVIFNYEMFSDENIREVIIQYLIKLFIKFKKIVSTRDLLNFIYEILVPSSVNEYDDLSFSYDYVDDLLPNLFFNNPERSDLLYLINQFDPIRVRNEVIDTFLINLNISENYSNIINEFLDFSKMNFDKRYFENLNEICFENKKELVNTLIRFAIFYGRADIKASFKDKVYQKYMNYLYSYNKQDNKSYKHLFKEVKSAIFNWKGSLKNASIEISETSSFKVYKKLKIKPKVIDFINVSADDDDRFKTSINIAFTSNNIAKKISIDYSLYEYIIKLNQGYKPNKLEKENLTVFEEFINSLINDDIDGDDKLLIKSLVDNEEFYFEFESDIENFTFGRA